MKQPLPPAQQYPAPVPVQIDMVSTTPGVQYVPIQAQTVTPEDSTPSHNLVLTVVITVICALINPPSLIVGIPALICAIKAYNAFQKRYLVTKSLGYTAAALCVVDIIFTGVVIIVIVGVALRCSPRSRFDGELYDDDRC